MKKVLILTYYWPPSGGAGVQRWLKFVKYMHAFGYEPIVYTAENGEMPVIDESLQKDIPKGTIVLKTPIWEPYNFYKKFIGRKKEDKINASFLSENKKAGLTEKISVWIRGNFFIPDARKFWIKPSINYLNDYIQKNKIDIVISSGPPHSMHLIALGLKKTNKNLKWIADFRDPWTNIDFYEKLMLTKWADNKHHKQELSVLQNADIVLSVGQTMSNEFLEMYKNSGGVDLNKFEVITNGYDDEDVKTGTITKDAKFSIAHIGTLVKDRNPQILWKALRKIVSENEKFKNQLEIKLVGKIDIYVKEQIDEFGLTQFVNKIDYLPHDKVIEEQQKSKLLLLLVNNTKNAKGILTGKFFEYMSANVPVLAIGPCDGDLAEIITKTKTGLISDFNDEQTLEKNILDYFNGKVIERNEAEVKKYSRKELTKKLCELIDKL
ncbi:MAG: glycosyltransferase [Bacteroidota bacterium]|nr:glycosyltransferase [Bacteroidota bacterium]MDP3147224.1 glycosyltransferase [Bacteroidota bacterium]